MMEILELPSELRLARYRIALTPQERFVLPAQKESALRGGLGWALKQGACIRPIGELCTTCAVPEVCPYAYLFEGRTPADAEVLSASSTIPQPYILAADSEKKIIESGERWVFTLTLVGNAIRYSPYLIAALRVLATKGLGERRVCCDLSRVDWLTPGGEDRVLFDERSARSLRAQPTPFLIQDWATQPTQVGERLTLHFETPTQLKHDGRILCGAPPFQVVVRSLIRRISSLNYFYAGQRWALDFRGWIDRAAAIDIAQADCGWVHDYRHSTRSGQRMPLGGVVGWVVYAGDVAPFAALLRVSEILHVGKNVVFGNGRCRLLLEERE